jgi:hypothetical protein
MAVEKMGEMADIPNDHDILLLRHLAGCLLYQQLIRPSRQSIQMATRCSMYVYIPKVRERHNDIRSPPEVIQFLTQLTPIILTPDS